MKSSNKIVSKINNEIKSYKHIHIYVKMKKINNNINCSIIINKKNIILDENILLNKISFIINNNIYIHLYFFDNINPNNFVLYNLILYDKNKYLDNIVIDDIDSLINGIKNIKLINNDAKCINNKDIETQLFDLFGKISICE